MLPETAKADWAIASGVWRTEKAEWLQLALFQEK